MISAVPQPTYDALDQLIQVTDPDNSTVGYGYDAVGNQRSLPYPDGRTAIYDYDPLNRLTAATDWKGQDKDRYDAANNLRRIVYPNNASISYRYDAADRLVKVNNRRQRSSSLLPVARFSYTLNELGYVIESVEKRRNASPITFPTTTTYSLNL